MPKTKPITKLDCDHARPGAKSYKLSAGYGLYLEIMPNGSKLWRYRYKWHGKDKRMACRLLLERVTHFCDKLVPDSEKGRQKLRIVFSRRTDMKYNEFIEYLKKLCDQSQSNSLYINKGDIIWPVIDFDEIFILDAKHSAGLQLADIGASAFFQALERNRPKDCEPECAKALKRVIAKKDGAALGYGIKTMPAFKDITLAPQQREIFEFYGLKKR